MSFEVVRESEVEVKRGKVRGSSGETITGEGFQDQLLDGL